MSDREEAFVQDELTSMMEGGCDLTVIPMRKRLPAPNAASIQTGLARATISQRLMDLAVARGAVGTLVRHPARSVQLLYEILRWSGGRRNLLNNLVSLPKALWLSGEVSKSGASHIHAYWLGHTATAAYVASTITGVPWSGTGYRWDIDAANLFGPKMRSAAFIRCADEFGRDRLTEWCRNAGRQPPTHLIRTGVHIGTSPSWADFPVDVTTICCIGAFVEKKAQVLIVRALGQLRNINPNIELHLFGDGPTGGAIHAAVADLGLDAAVHFHGTVPLADVRAFLRTRPITVLPSIVTDDHQSEGIPVTLVEAMANGSPVISTPTGSIPNLVTEGCGLLVTPGSVDALVAAITSIVSAPTRADAMSRRAYARVRDEFDVARTSDRVLELCIPKVDVD